MALVVLGGENTLLHIKPYQQCIIIPNFSFPMYILDLIICVTLLYYRLNFIKLIKCIGKKVHSTYMVDNYYYLPKLFW